MSGVGLNVGNVPVKQVYVGSTPVREVYVGSELVWPTAVRITLGTDLEAQAQFRAALSARGLNYQTVTEIPFDIELVGSGSARLMFYNCAALTHAPAMDTSQVTNMSQMFYDCASLTSVPDMDTSNVTDMTNMFRDCSALTHVPDMDTSSVTDMNYMFWGCASLTTAPALVTSSVTTMNQMFRDCSALTHVPDMDTAQVTNMRYMFYDCAALTDGNVRLIGKHPNVDTTGMINNSGLTREPWYTADGQPWPTAEVHEVTITNATGIGTAHPLLTVTVPAGETWDVRIQGTITKASQGGWQPFFRIGTADSGTYGQGAAVDFSGTVTPANSTIALVSNDFAGASFTGTVTIEK